MGVDYYACRGCGETFPDCGNYVSCECGENWCCEECAGEDGFNDEHTHKPSWSCYELDTSCDYCLGKNVDDSVLLLFLMEKYDINKQQAISEYNTSKES